MLRIAGLAVALPLLAPLPVVAAVSGPPAVSCKLMETPDGFVALRDGPNAQAKVIVEMNPKGVVILRTDRARWKRGSWNLVSYWRPGSAFEEAVKTGPMGWMNERHQQGCG